MTPVYSTCLCPPGPRVRHMCVHGQHVPWLRHDGVWWRVEARLTGRAPRAVERWLAMCETWDDVLALAPDLTVSRSGRGP
jgi:hypothetical protein